MTRRSGESQADALESDGVVQQVADEIVDVVKPRLRGWLHTGVLPVALIAGIVLIALAPPRARFPATVFVIASVLLFGTSAIYHRGNWSPRPFAVLKRLDHANIYLIIAGSYTPFAVLALKGTTSSVILWIVWGGAIGGVLFRLFWVDAPRWLYTSLYILVGWVAVFVAPQLIREAGLATAILVGVGGILYTLGAIVYATRKPDPSPVWFGFHEVFHSFTVAAWIVHFIAVALVVQRT
jgi:hemolysin III